MEKVRIGITVGDVNGIGLEVILKALSDERMLERCIPIIYGSSKVVAYHKNIAKVEVPEFAHLRDAEEAIPNAINIVNCWAENVNIKPGAMNETGGKYAFRSLERATMDAKSGLIDVLVTAPINKEAMQLAGFEYPGHTEYLTATLGAESSLMLMVHDSLRVGVVTNHIAVRDIAKQVDRTTIIKKLKLMHETLRIDFGIEKPKIAVLALNPHAGDGGLIGGEEMSVIIPAIEQVKDEGVLAIGPYPADGFFGKAMYSKFDGILAMYHDQGLIPFKTLAHDGGVNYTAGLSIIRTSPDHGTALDIAGSSSADPASFRMAMFLAIDIHYHRTNYLEMHANPMKSRRDALIQEDEDISVLPDYE